MPRCLLLAIIPVLVFAAACGGDGDDGDPTASPTLDPAQPAPTRTPQLLPTPPRASDDEVIVNVSAGANVFAPTLKEFRDLPKTKIDAKGQKEGVTLEAIGQRVSAPAASYVTLQGFRTDGRMIQFVRQPLADIGRDSILVLDDSGRVSFFSSKLGEGEWLVNVTVVSFQ